MGKCKGQNAKGKMQNAKVKTQVFLRIDWIFEQ